MRTRGEGVGLAYAPELLRAIQHRTAPHVSRSAARGAGNTGVVTAARARGQGTRLSHQQVLPGRRSRRGRHVLQNACIEQPRRPSRRPSAPSASPEHSWLRHPKRDREGLRRLSASTAISASSGRLPKCGRRSVSPCVTSNAGPQSTPGSCRRPPSSSASAPTLSRPRAGSSPRVRARSPATASAKLQDWAGRSPVLTSRFPEDAPGGPTRDERAARPTPPSNFYARLSASSGRRQNRHLLSARRQRRYSPVRGAVERWELSPRLELLRSAAPTGYLPRRLGSSSRPRAGSSPRVRARCAGDSARRVGFSALRRSWERSPVLTSRFPELAAGASDFKATVVVLGAGGKWWGLEGILD